MVIASIFILANIRYREYMSIAELRTAKNVRDEARRGLVVEEGPMAEAVVLGASPSGTIMANELLPQLRSSDTLTVVGQDPRYHFLPSNPWVAIGWGDPDVPSPGTIVVGAVRGTSCLGPAYDCSNG
jgi:hypothetical protein